MPPFTRTVKITATRAAGDDRTIDLAISSEAPYERWFGIEILSHDFSAVDLSRLADNAHPLLLNHCTDDQIGVLFDPIIGEDRVLRCKAKFSRSADAEEIFVDVRDGIRQLVSVGYFIEEIVEMAPPPAPEDIGDLTKWSPVRTFTGDQFQREMRELHGETFARHGQATARANGDTPPTFLVTRWTPFEASIVPIPADPSVGIGRSTGVETIPPPSADDQATQQPKAPIAAPRIFLEKKTMEQKSPAELEIERRDALQAIGQQYAKYLGPNDLADAIRNGRSVEAFKDYIIERIQTKHTDTSQIHDGLTPKEIRRYSLGNAIRAATIGDWSQAGFERECSEAVAKIMGRSPEGFYIPPEAFRDFNVGTATEAGNLVATDLRTDLFVDVLRNKLVLGQLGVRILSGLTSSVDLPRKSTASTIGTVTEVGSATETSPATAKVSLSPKRASAFVEVSKQAIIQSALALESMIRDDLVMSTAVTIENLAINGNGTAPQYLGLRNTTGIGTVVSGANGAAPAWSHFVDLESACANANAEPDSLSGYLINTRVRGKLKQTQFATNLPMIWQNGPFPLNGYRAAVSNNVPFNLTKGTSTTVCSSALFGSDWSMAVLGLFGAPDVTVDPYTLAATGQVRITINQYADFGVRHPGAFAKNDDLLAG
jgi:HK97 family phage major capsid protein